MDAIDDRLQDLLIERLEIVARVAAAKDNGSVPPHVPAREAQIIRRLVGRQGDRFPLGTLVRIWRELLAATVRAQGSFAVAAYATPEAAGVWDLARDHYGSQGSMIPYQSTMQVIRSVTDRRVTVGVLPMPQDGEKDPWWLHLLSPDVEGPRVIGRLPFGPRGNARADGDDALAIGYGPQQASGADRTLIATENAVDISHGRFSAALSAAGFNCTLIISCDHAQSANTLIEIDGFVPLADPRIAQLRARLGTDLLRLFAVGCYPVPLPKPSAARVELSAPAAVAAAASASAVAASAAAARGSRRASRG
ncbi:MAG: chorismate mutase [Alphaproteobacteria bacterium]|nr:chorismate mutase [Alphaproteobacteria bacterium]